MRTKMLCAALIAGVAGGAAAQNLMTNGSFETLQNQFILYTDWENYNNVFNDASVEVPAPDGSNSAKMFGQFGGEQSDQVLLQYVDGITPGQQYTLSCMSNHLGTSPIETGNLILLQLNFQDAGGAGLETVQTVAIEPGVTPTDVWRRVEVSGIAPPNTSRILVALLHLQLDGIANGASFWDDVELVEGAPPVECQADLAAPFGVLNFFDIQAYINLFNQGCP